MGRLTNYTRDQLRDHLFRTATFAKPANLYLGLLLAGGYWQANSTYAVGDTIVPSTPNGRIYRVTAITTGTSGAAEPTWPTTEGASVTDGGVTWTEQSLAIEAGTFDEVVAASYARVPNNPANANWDAPATGNTTNVPVLTFPAPAEDWTPGGAIVAAYMLFDALTAGNALWWTGLTTPVSIMANDPAPKFAANAASYTI